MPKHLVQSPFCQDLNPHCLLTCPALWCHMTHLATAPPQLFWTVYMTPLSRKGVQSCDKASFLFNLTLKTTLKSLL